MGLALCEQEELWVASLDTKNRVIGLSKVYRGNVNSSIIRAAEVLRDAVRLTATAVVVAHNHPSGDPTPSPEDVTVSRTLGEAACVLGIELLDSLVICPGRWVSLKERGLGF
jgi:DNA repair protein RadC